MGGNITLRAMVVSDEIKAGVIWGGVVVSYPDLVDLWWRAGDSSTAPTQQANRRRFSWRTELTEIYGSFEENPEFWASISANSYAADLSGPIQLHHGTADESVPYELSEVLYSEITAVNLPVEIYLYEGDNHNISNFFWSAMQRTVEFFDAHVKGINGE
jgi:dipeptidyl aminopeptidase/acylaminoacyl peptidase